MIYICILYRYNILDIRDMSLWQTALLAYYKKELWIWICLSEPSSAESKILDLENRMIEDGNMTWSYSGPQEI